MSAKIPSAARRVAIAIVDDDGSVRSSLRRLCEVFGLSVTVYASGSEFLASLDGGAPPIDCLLLDVQMPEINGLELHRRLVMRGAHIPTILYTGGDAPEVPPHNGANDIVGYLRKPVSATDLFAAIERALGDRDPTA